MISKVLLAALVMAAALVPAQAQDDDDTPSLDDTPHITIVGTASREVAPDLAVITLGVMRHKLTAVAAADAVAITAQAVVAAAKAQGAKDTDIATRSLDLNQTFDEQHDPQGRLTARRPSGFDASNSITIRIRDLARAGELAQNLIDKGANSFDGINFTVEHPDPILDQLASEATSNARRQAEMVARAAGVKIGRVLLIERPDGGPARTRGALPYLSRATTIVPSKSMPVEAGTTTLDAEMKVVWALER